MPRIEQMSNGTYVRRLNTTEQQIIDRMYKESAERETNEALLKTRVGDLEKQLITTVAELNNMKIKLGELEGKVN